VIKTTQKLNNSIKRLIIDNNVMAKVILTLIWWENSFSVKNQYFQKFHLDNTYLYGQNEKYNV
jgi:hypothetical protein